MQAYVVGILKRILRHQAKFGWWWHAHLLFAFLSCALHQLHNFHFEIDLDSFTVSVSTSICDICSVLGCRMSEVGFVEIISPAEHGVPQQRWGQSSKSQLFACFQSCFTTIRAQSGLLVVPISIESHYCQYFVNMEVAECVVAVMQCALCFELVTDRK